MFKKRKFKRTKWAQKERKAKKKRKWMNGKKIKQVDMPQSTFHLF